ncbi:MAG: hypothetical protein M3470_09795 [Chloroflexota bacterium]|nr:hypothetical protein [Chloroflexota bacterium]
MNPIVMIAPSTAQTRLLVRYGGREVLRAVMPPPMFAHPRAASALLEGLSLWYQKRLSVVLCASDEAGSCSALGLCDEAFDLPAGNVYYEVGVADIRPRRRRRLGGPGDFRDLLRVSLLEVLP